MTKRCLVFPGQGSQYTGMGKELYDTNPIAKQTFNEADEALGFSLSEIIFGSDEEKLKLTYNTQPALLVTSIAILRVLLDKLGNKKVSDISSAVAGHSLGEYTALCAAGSLSLADAVRTVYNRGKFMYDSCPDIGAMAALIGADIDSAKKLSETASKESGEVCVVANDNTVGQVVISGHQKAVSLAAEKAKDFEVKKAVMLPVSGPFHSPLMSKAQEQMKEFLTSITIVKPSVPVICNITAQTTEDPTMIKDLLIQQIVGSVRWRETILLCETLGFSEMVEIGPKQVLASMVVRTSAALGARSVETLEQISGFEI